MFGLGATAASLTPWAKAPGPDILRCRPGFTSTATASNRTLLFHNIFQITVRVRTRNADPAERWTTCPR